MQRIKVLFTLITLLAVTSTLCLAQDQSRSKLIAALDSTAEAHAADSTVAGAAVAVVHGGDTLLLDGYGFADLEFDVPTPPDAVYQIASITKQFTAAAILQLAEADLIDLDAHINEYVPDYDTRGHRVTVRQLLYHTSGIRDYARIAAIDELESKNLPRDTLLSLVEAEPFRFAPGTVMSYSNTGYFLLGFIVEEASGQPYEDYVREHLLEPAGMEDSYSCEERAVVRHRAHGYEWDDTEGFRRIRIVHPTWRYAAGGLCSTAGDLVAWNQALHDGRILSDSVYQRMITPGQLTDGSEIRAGMGAGVIEFNGDRIIGVAGDYDGFLSWSSYYPDDDLIVVVLQNTNESRPPQELAIKLAQLILGPGQPPKVTPYQGDFSLLAGRYSGPARGRILTIEIKVEDEQLVAHRTGETPEGVPLEHMTGLTWMRGLTRYHFVRIGDRIVELRLDTGGGYYVLRRVEER